MTVHAARPAYRPRRSPSGPGTWSASTAPARRSPRRSACRFEGELARAGTAYVRFNADLSRYVAHRPSILHWIMNPAGRLRRDRHGPAARRPAVGRVDRRLGLRHGQRRAGPVRRAACSSKIRTLVGDPDLQVEHRAHVARGTSTSSTPPTTQVGRVLCGGDAVHRHPPSSGLGSNTCVQDAFNLAWKLAFVVKGHAGPELLDSYTPERAPVGKQIVARANQSRKDYAGAAGVRSHRDSDDPVARRPGQAQGGQPGGRRAPRAALRGAGAEEHRVQRARRRAQPALRVRRRHARPDRRDGGVAAAPRALPAGHHPARGQTPARLAGRRRRQPGLHPGRHRQGQADPAHRAVGGQAWKHAAQKLDLPFLRTVVVGEPGHHRPLRLLARVREIDEAGVLLVRPDGYVAWRVSTAVWDADEATAPAQDALTAVLASPSTPAGAHPTRPSTAPGRPIAVRSPSQPSRPPARPSRHQESTHEYPPVHQCLVRPGPGRVLPGFMRPARTAPATCTPVTPPSRR